MTEVNLCEKDSCWCSQEADQSKVAVMLDGKTVDSILSATMTPAIFWEVVQACRNTVTPHPRWTNLNGRGSSTQISAPASVHP